MRKTVSITISGQLFHVEEAAYKKLDEYLDAIRYHFLTYEDHDEIVSDIESRVAEHFSEKLTKARNVVSEEDVDHLIAHMGTVKDFEEFAGEGAVHDGTFPAGNRSYNTSKRLYRDADNQMIAGVAAGIANYFGIDPTIVRLLFAVSLLFGGAGLVIYIVLWVVMPEAKTTSEKMEMRGQPLTLKKIEASIRENIPSAKEHIKPGTISKIIQFPFMLVRQLLRAAGKFVRAVVPVIGRILGFIIATVACVALFMLTFAVIMFASGAWDSYMDVPLRELSGNLVYYMVLASGYIAILIPVLFALFIGIALLLLRNVFRFQIVIPMLALWVVSLMLGAVTIGQEGPVLAQKIEQYVEAHETEATKQIEVGSFRSVQAYGNYDVRIRKGDAPSISVTGTTSAVEHISATVENGVLTISRERGENRFCIICIDNSAVVEVTVTDPALENVESHANASIDLDGINITGGKIVASAGSRIVSRNGSMPGTVVAEASGGSRIDIEAPNNIEELVVSTVAGSRFMYEGDVERTNIDIHAGSRVDLTGSGTVLNATAVAGSRLSAFEFSVREAHVEVSAGAQADINVSDILTGFAQAGGEIEYVGDPEIDVETDPSGRVNRIGGEHREIRSSREER